MLRFGFEKSVLSASGIDSLAARIESLKSPDPVIRRWSATTLGVLEPKTKAAVTALLDALSDPDENVRVCASVALVQIGDLALPQILALVKSNKAELRRSALGLLGCNELLSGDSLPVFINCLADDDPLVRKIAVEGLGRMSANREIVLRGIMTGIADKNSDVRKAATAVLARNYSDDLRSTDLLIAALRDSDAGVRIAGAEGLEAMGAKAKKATRPLLKAMDFDDPAFQFAYAGALGKIGPKDKHVITALVSLLENKNPLTKAAAANGLRKIGPRAIEAVPLLVENLNLYEASNSGSPRGVRCQTILALGAIGAGAKQAVPGLISIIEDKRCSQLERMEAARALGEIGPSAKPADLTLSRFLERNDIPPALRPSIASAIRKIRGS